MNNRKCSYELFTEKHISKATVKMYTKAYYIICSMCRSTLVESNKIGFSILWFFCDLLWFFKDSAKINKKEKDKTAFKTAYNKAREVKWTVLKIEEGVLPDFEVQREKNGLSRKLRR